MKSLILNIGSTSIKYSIYDNKSFVLKGKTEDILEVIGMEKPDRIIARIVFGADKVEPIKINKQSLKLLNKYNKYAPLHNPPTMVQLESIINKFPTIDVYGVFDSAFHQTIKEDRYTIPLPVEITKKYNLRKYGYHGFSHQYLAYEYARINKVKKFNIITCHLGGGSSVTAIKDGVSVATSMGFGPDEGLVMVKRIGTIGGGVVLNLIESGLSTQEVRDIIYTKSGILGLSGTDDVKTVFDSNDKKYQVVFDIFINSVVDYIFSYIGYLESVDCVILTGGIGENNKRVQDTIRDKLKPYGISLQITPTNEEIMMLKSIDN